MVDKETRKKPLLLNNFGTAGCTKNKSSAEVCQFYGLSQPSSGIKDVL